MKFLDDQLTTLSDLVHQRLGLNFPRHRWKELERGLAATCDKLGLLKAEQCVKLLQSDLLERRHVEVLAMHLTVGETYFFRDEALFEKLERSVIPELVERNAAERRMRIWCAGCSTGEEPYSVAMLLHHAVRDALLWNITILATDINTRSLEHAHRAVYGEWSFRGTRPEIKRSFFRRVSNKYELLPHIKKMVTFSYLNLNDDVYPSLLTNTNAMDVIICRNVLMYFSSDRQLEVIRRFHRSLNEGGFFFPGASDFSHTILDGFESIRIPGVFGFRKEAPRPREVPVEPPPAEFADSRFEIFPTPAVEPIATTPSYEGAELLPAGDQPPREPDFQRMAEEGHGAMAIEELRQRLNDEPNNTTHLVMLGRLLANIGDFREALTTVERAVMLDRVDYRAHFVRGLILHEMGDNMAAMESIRRALFLEPDFAPGHFAMANLCHETGRNTEAQRHIAQARHLLTEWNDAETLPESEGLQAGLLRGMLNRAFAG